MLDDKPEDLLYKKIEDLFDKKTDELKDLLYNFTVLHERMSEDKLEFTKQAIKIEQVAKDLTVHIGELGKAKDEIKKEVKSVVYDVSSDIYTNVGEKTKEVIKKDIDETVNHIQWMLHQAKETSENLGSIYMTTTFKGYFLAFMVAIALGLILVWLLGR